MEKDKLQLKNFVRIYDDFFRFIYTLKKVTYSSGVIFYKPCTDEYFAEVFPLIEDVLLWLEQVVDSIKSQVRDKLPMNADPCIFEQLYIISFSLFFKEKCYIPSVQLAYGNEEGETYLIVILRNKQIVSIDLNE